MSYFLTTQSGFSAVPLDCLQEIFQYLENDMKSLYRCMLVNRTWCRINIALLWRRPFEYSGPELTGKYSELIRTYVTCLHKKSKTDVQSAGYDILDQRPLFHYHKYLKELDCDKLGKAIEEWEIRNCYTDYHDEQKNILHTALLKLLLSYCEGLWKLRLGRYCDKYNFPCATRFPYIKCNLTNLRKLEVLGDLDCLEEEGLNNFCTFLRNLSNISNNLEYIDIDTTEDKKSLSGQYLQKLIKSQKNLSFFRYNQECSDIRKTEEFVEALSHNASTLKNIEFSNLTFNIQCLSPLKKFNNLECMQFVYCHEKDISNETEEIIEQTSQLKVKKLIFHKGMLTSVTLEILRLANISVRELTVDNVIPDLFKHIYEHCPNITYLATRISQKNVDSLEYLSASKIEHLILKTLDNDTNLITKDFSRIGKNLSLYLNHLSLDLNISAEEFSCLLKECRSPLESLCLKFDIKKDSDLENKDGYLKAVMEFAKENDSLKEFRFSLNNKTNDYSLKNKKVEDIKAEDIFSKDILEEAKLYIPSILRETKEHFAYINLNSEALL
ncbi:hypothetical protein RclHR1_03960017 [Rhizophagus clarus]|uniref:F-box domain-containing protein n=1 Tax=Rhizophagus clarus TaxID=94130 RepID=A0A2Z6RHZ3_9GLOM|nr:hypothetical protein RclHR1_03960017 [Rhizophagus clarus]